MSEIAGASVHFICVGTPQKRGEFGADLAYVDAAFDGVLAHLGPDDLVVGKSTVPVGTAERLAQRLTEAGSTATLVWNPEFLREGFAVKDTLHPDRLVLGVASDRAEKIMREVYASMLEAGTP